jgi:hypothetical protein
LAPLSQITISASGYQGFFKENGQGAVLVKKGQFASYKEKLEKWTEFHYF